MNYVKLKELILQNAALSEYVVTNDMPKQNAYAKDSAIADAINAAPDAMLELVTYPAKRGDFLRTLGPITGSVLFGKIKSLAASYEPLLYIVAELEGDGLLVDSEETLSSFCDLLSVSTSLDTNDIANINKVFHQKVSVTAGDVSHALRNPL